MSLPDLTTTLQQLRQGQTTWQAQWEQALAAAQSPACQHAFLSLNTLPAQTAQAVQGPLGGLSVSVKDLFDVAGEVTTAGSRVLQTQPPAQHDAVAVARLKAAGAQIMGRTNMTEFAFSGVGVNPHHGTPANVADSVVARVPGGSSCGAAVSVASGAAFIGLGSDTGGSIRIPAALQGLVGFKNTANLVPTTGAFPLSHTLDTACALTRSVNDAILAHEILCGQRVERTDQPLAGYKLAVVPEVMFDGIEPAVLNAFEAAVSALQKAGAQIAVLKLPELLEIAGTAPLGNFSAAEAYARQHQMLAEQGDLYDPRVYARMQRGAAMSAKDYLQLLNWRQDWMARVQARIQGFDALLSPTVPIVAPPLSEVAPGAERDEAFFKVNALLLRNTSVVNLLDGCGLSLPCHAAGALPVGLMVWHAGGHDEAVLNISLQIEQGLQALRH
jgi:Asp-tRNA(Asn)/Glu-tRNA(Gln) amidotransferase A subunit family amidase